MIKTAIVLLIQLNFSHSVGILSVIFVNNSVSNSVNYPVLSCCKLFCHFANNSVSHSSSQLSDILPLILSVTLFVSMLNEDLERNGLDSAGHLEDPRRHRRRGEEYQHQQHQAKYFPC